jgi:hypothetical protein
MSTRKAATVPHSWTIERWPPEVFPNSPNRARYVIRSHKDELTSAGCISRVGREIVVIGERYARWLEKANANVAGYEVAANRDPEARAS